MSSIPYPRKSEEYASTHRLVVIFFYEGSLVYSAPLVLLLAVTIARSSNVPKTSAQALHGQCLRRSCLAIVSFPATGSLHSVQYFPACFAARSQ